MKKLFIISSKSGKSDYKIAYEKLLKNFSTDEIKISKNKDDVKKFARQYRDKVDVIIILGVDGALSESAGELAGSKTALSLIPMGTANDFSKNFDYTDFDIENFKIEKIKKIDLMKINDEISINIASLGFDTNVLVYAYDYMKRKNAGANLSYIYGVFKSIVNLENTKLNIIAKTEDGEINIEGDYLISALCNGSYYGNGFNPSPNGKIDDGILNLILGEKMSLIKLATLIMAYKKGKHLGRKGIREIKTTSGIIKSDREFLYNIDGEIRKASEIKYEVLKGALNWAYLKGE
ncbi:diacylglycerol kinase family lipid kinase [Peptoniphilus sp. MSJ-1]|uniref:Diacylglycerol kinase family lipid kinase n=1 Tax=Peptoniphilus ovalis TaxID=2841503 RepID=A0ABS6FES3_9FIRM|nr:diacylglycerol kinase family protein [Peptoniphilus ovalis]MBU5668665.1 diacylglycerol kinase family lipid kinase [Peptoniphilus ovalis]